MHSAPHSIADYDALQKSNITSSHTYITIPCTSAHVDKSKISERTDKLENASMGEKYTWKSDNIIITTPVNHTNYQDSN